MLERVRYSDWPSRYEYRLSARGEDLFGSTLLLHAWEQVWMPRNGGSDRLRHWACGHLMTPELVCRACGKPASFHDTRYEILSGHGAESVPAPIFRRFTAGDGRSDSTKRRARHDITDIIGDRWTLLVLSAGFLGLKRFEAMQSTLQIASNILAHRLDLLVRHGILERRQYCTQPSRFEYLVTLKGRDLFPVALMLMQWGDRWLTPAATGNLRVVHTDCGQSLRGVVACDRCSAPIRPSEVTLGKSFVQRARATSTPSG